MNLFVVSYTALLALLAAQVVANNGDNSNQYNKPNTLDRERYPDGEGYRSHGENTQVLWGQCGGYYYYGTDRCPKGAYCRYFSDWYSQCNPLDN